MAASSPDQPATANTVPNQAPPRKRRFWLRLIIAFIVFTLIAILILVLLTWLKIPLAQQFAPLLTKLSPVFGAIGAFVNATLSDKDFQQSFRKWLAQLLFGDSGGTAKGNQDAGTSTQTTVQPSITINVSPTITNTNTATAAGTTGSTDTTGTPPAQLQPANPAPQQQPVTASTAAKPPASSDPIFFPNMKLTNLREFYGRAIERTQLLSRTRNGGCTSIIGPRRSGKTWLMTYLRLVAGEQLGANFRIGYMSATLPSCATAAGFTREALIALGHPLYALPERPNLALLQHVVRDMVAQNNTPILCIDEFEGLTQHPECDLQFFEGLRAITEIGLGLVVLSKKPLIEIVSETTRTSPFFNVFLQLPLRPFDREDAEKFLQEKGAQGQFSEQERAYLLAYGQSEKEQFPPLRLQLVGETLLNEKRVAVTAGQHHYRPNDPEYWQVFKERVDATYSGMVKS